MGIDFLAFDYGSLLGVWISLCACDTLDLSSHTANNNQ